MTYHVSKFCPSSWSVCPQSLPQPNYRPVEKLSTFAARDEAFLGIAGARDVSTHDQKVRTFFRPGASQHGVGGIYRNAASHHKPRKLPPGDLRGPDTSADSSHTTRPFQHAARPRCLWCRLTSRTGPTFPRIAQETVTMVRYDCLWS